MRSAQLISSMAASTPSSMRGFSGASSSSATKALPAVPGPIPPATLSVLENRFKDIVAAHVQGLLAETLATFENSLDCHRTELSRRLERIEADVSGSKRGFAYSF